MAASAVRPDTTSRIEISNVCFLRLGLQSKGEGDEEG